MAPKKKDLFGDDDASSSSSSSSDSSSSDDSSTSSASKTKTKTTPKKKDTQRIKSIDNDNNDEEELRITVNKKFATKYQNKKELEELQQIRQRKQRDGTAGDSELDSSDEEEDEDGLLFTPSVNVQFLKTIKALRKKDDSIYDPKSQFFDEHVENNGDDDDDDDENKTKARKPQRYKDVVREQILEQIEEEENKGANSTNNGKVVEDGSNPRTKLAYDEQQDELRKAFLTESSNAEGENEDDWMVVKKAAATPDLDKLEQEATEELKEIENLSKKSKKNNKGGDDDVFKDPRGEVGDGEQFLLDFITNKKWIDHNDLNRAGDDSDDDDGDESSLDDVDRADDYESNYNFRFEQAAQETATSGAMLSVQTYARGQTMNTVRRQDTTRKDKREARKERKSAERKAKEEQLKRLKNAKKQEINKKLSQVKAVIGGVEETAVDEAAIMKMLEGDYDPEKFEKAMEQAYGEDFYQKQDDEWKTDLDVRQTLKGDDEGDDLVGQDDVNGGMYDNVQEGEVNEDAMEEEDYDENEEWNDDGYDDSQKESKFEKKLKTKMQDELYKLDYEDIVAGMPTRFKYREVESNDFGLTTQEILFARDTTLKQFVSLKKLAPYNEQGEFNAGSRKRRKFREMLKRDLEENLPTEEESQETDAENNEAAPAEPEPKKKRRRLKKGKKKSKDDVASSDNASLPKKTEAKEEETKPSSIDEVENSNETKKRRRKKNGKKGESSNKETSSENIVLDRNDTEAGEKNDKATESDLPKSDSKKRRSKSNSYSSDDKQKKKKRKSKDKKSSIAGISHSRLASYGL